MTENHATPLVTSSPCNDRDLVLFGWFLDSDIADRAFAWLVEGLMWRQEHITLFGRTHPIPRLTAWYGDPGCSYAYSGIRHEPEPWPPELLELKAAVEGAAQTRFNSVLCNLYRDERDGNGWHADNERELGEEPAIASLSLGASRTCRFRDTATRRHAFDVELTHGSLLLMRGRSQARWQHSIPKGRRPCGARVNLTFRTIRDAGR